MNEVTPPPVPTITCRDVHSLWEELTQAAAESPHAPFLRMVTGEWTYSQMVQQALAASGGLRHMGVAAGSNVSLLLPNCAEFVIAWFALTRLGAVTAPVNTAARGALLRDALALVGSEVLIVHESLWPHFEAVRAELPGLQTVIVVGQAPAGTQAWSALLGNGPDQLPPHSVHFSDLCLLLYTSGSTGRSKAVRISHRFVLRQARGVIEGLGLRPDDVLYCPYPLFHLDAAVMTVAPALLMRGVAAIGERFSVSRYWDEVRTLQATVFDFMGATITMLWKQPPSPRDRDHRARLGWGVPLPSWAPEFEQRFGCRLVELYGSTEVGAILYTPLDAPPRPGSCGKLQGPWRVMLADADGFEVPVAMPGELLVRPEEPSVLMDGYWGQPQESLAALRNQWFHTGDILRRDEDGWFYFVGRSKDIVRRRGENISAAEVEQSIEEHPAILECAVIGVPSELTEEDVMAWVVLRPEQHLAPNDIADWCRERMAAFMVPRFIRIVEQLPKTPTDKVEKTRLREQGCAGAWDRESPLHKEPR